MNTLTARANRVYSIDFLRGTVMIIMALDHVRDYFHKYSHYYDPTDLPHTSYAIFFTRWITHFCAPVFIFLAGTSAFLSGQKKTRQQLSAFLLKRGAWLMLLEITLVGFGWFFNPLFSLWALQVIWVLGGCMIALAGLIYLPFKWIIAIGLIMVFGHNLLDGIHVKGQHIGAIAWSELHDPHIFHFNKLMVMAAYPLIPWMGVMALGYCFGRLYLPSFDAVQRKRVLLTIGLLGCSLFIVLRLSNLYGDASKWDSSLPIGMSVMSFFNVSKYPPSLLYLLMTLCPACLFLAVFENASNRFTRIVSTYGRVPLFYYLIHIYVLHVGAMMLAAATGFSWKDMVFSNSWITAKDSLHGYGINLPGVYLVWLLTLALLYPLCRKYDEYKQRNKAKWWLSYL